jgi:hypothetical protein
MKVEDFIHKEYGVISIMGMRGCGKTHLAASLEFREELKVLYIDTAGAFRQKMPEKYYIAFDKMRTVDEIEEVIGGHFDDPKNRELIVDISELNRSDMIAVCDILWDILKCSQMKWALIIDEISELCPQTRVFYSEGIETCARMGRNKGVLFFVMTNQRMQKVNKDILNLSDCYVIFKFVARLDQQAVRGVLDWDDMEFYKVGKEIKELGVGEYMITDGVSIDWYKRGSIPQKIEEPKKTESSTVEKVSEKVIVTEEKIPPPELKSRRVWTDEKVKKLKELRENGYTMAECGKIFKCSVTAIMNACSKYLTGGKKDANTK